MASIYRASRRQSSSVSWTLVGLALGTAAGFAAAIWYGPVKGRKPSHWLRPPSRFRSSAPHMAPLVREVERLLQADPLLGPLALEAVAVSQRRIELHGWVPSRDLRARAWRTARQAPGIDSLINCILVRGEDDSLSASTSA